MHVKKLHDTFWLLPVCFKLSFLEGSQGRRMYKPTVCDAGAISLKDIFGHYTKPEIHLLAKRSDSCRQLTANSHPSPFILM